MTSPSVWPHAQRYLPGLGKGRKQRAHGDKAKVRGTREGEKGGKGGGAHVINNTTFKVTRVRRVRPASQASWGIYVSWGVR